MPCGGIWPMDVKGQVCWVCNRPTAKHFMEEWDAYIHAKCALQALNYEHSDVQVVLDHKHTVTLDFDHDDPMSAYEFTETLRPVLVPDNRSPNDSPDDEFDSQLTLDL